MRLVPLTSILCFAFGSLTSGQEPDARFIGDWCNKDFNTRGMTRLQIQKGATGFTLHGWGRCTPKECDWGQNPAAPEGASGGPLISTWNHGFSVVTQKLTLLPDGNLESATHTHFTDQSGRKDYDDKVILAKGLKHDWNQHGRR